MLKRWIVIMSLITWSSFGFAGEVLRLTVGNIRPSDPHSMEKFKSSIEQMQRSRLQIIQFKGPIQASDRLQLESRGLRVHAYIPDDAYIVEGSPEVLSRFALEPRVNSVLPIPSAWKKSADLPKVSIFNRDQQVALMVQLVDDQADSAFRKALQNFSEVEILAGEGKAYYLRIQLAQLDELIRLDQVIWVQTLAPMKLQYLDIPEYLGDGGNGDFGLTGDYTDLTGYESGTRIMGFEEAWQRGLDGRGQLVAMADTGLDSGEVTTLLLDLRGRVAKGYSFGIGASSWSDPMGHGTHVAGSVASHGAASGGLIRGGAFAAQFIPEGMWSPIIDNLTVPPKLGKLFSAVYSDGARIHTNSWGGGQLPGAYDSFAAQVDEYIWANPDMLILFAAGNNGRDADKNGRIDENSMASPGSAKNVLTVGASENFLNKGGIQRKLGELMGGDAWNVEPLGSDTLSNNANGLAVFSSRGPCRDGRIKPDVVAPGT
ncbi:MAG: S8 family serine peptidase, partial [Bdellovibrionales bacterium]|nr:S8 family serine peptidase [Bdellovibrionales bacterium]